MAHQGGTLQQVVAHWLPRMQTAGLTASDLARVIDETGDWRNWCRTFCREGDRHIAEGQEAEAAGRTVTAGEAYLRAALFFHFGQFMFFDDLEQKREADRRKVNAYERAAPFLLPPARAVSVPFRGGQLKGYIRLPARTPAPLAILVPGSDSTKEEFASLESFFLQRGLATFTLDGPGQGEGREFGFLEPDWASVLDAAVSALRGEAAVDGTRVGVMGMAFGGHLVLQGAHAIPGLRGAICMNGFFDLGAFWDDLPEVYRRNMRYALGGADIDETAARAAAFSLRGAAPPDCPVLVIHGGKDRIFPVEQAEALGAFGGHAEVVVYPDGNHVCNNIAYRYRALMADWLAERLAASSDSRTR